MSSSARWLRSKVTTGASVTGRTSSRRPATASSNAEPPRPTATARSTIASSSTFRPRRSNGMAAVPRLVWMATVPSSSGPKRSARAARAAAGLIDPTSTPPTRTPGRIRSASAWRNPIRPAITTSSPSRKPMTKRRAARPGRASETARKFGRSARVTAMRDPPPHWRRTMPPVVRGSLRYGRSAGQSRNSFGGGRSHGHGGHRFGGRRTNSRSSERSMPPGGGCGRSSDCR